MNVILSYVKNILHDIQKQKAEFWIGTFKIKKRTKDNTIYYKSAQFDLCSILSPAVWKVYVMNRLKSLFNCICFSSLSSLGLKIKESLNKKNY